MSWGGRRESGKHILITGGAGFIGSHLAEALLRRGDSVCVLDDLSTGSAENIRRLQDSPRFCFKRAGLDNAQTLRRLVGRADAVVHLAAAVGVHLVLESPARTIETNVQATRSVLAAARGSRARILLASTSEVYGRSAALPYSEEGDLLLGPPTRGRWSYAASKLLDEFLGLAAHREFGVPVTIMRFFNVVGRRQSGRYGAVLPRFVGQALRGEPLTVYGDGGQTRCFCHVSDAARAVVALLQHPAEACGEIFNVGSDREVTVRETAEMVIERAGSSSGIVHVPYDQAYGPGYEDLRRRVPDISKIGAAVGWKPCLLLPDILDDMISGEREETLGRSRV